MKTIRLSITAAALALGSINPARAAPSSQTLADVDEAIADYQPRLPLTLMDGGGIMLELYGYRRSDDMIIFDMRLDGATIATTKQKQFMVSWMRNGTCKDKDRRALMNFGFRLGYLVYDPNNHKLLEDVITLQQCSSQ